MGDALCTRIGIVASGGLVCIGTQLRLKRRFGDGLRLKIALSPPPAGQLELPGAAHTETQALREYVSSQISSDAKHVHSFKLTHTFMLPTELAKISVVFDELLSAKRHGIHIREWS